MGDRLIRKKAEIILDIEELSNHTKLENLDSGGQSKVHLLVGTPPVQGFTGKYVFKEYNSKVLRDSSRSIVNAMPRLILYPDSFSETERQVIAKHTVWPQALVTRDGLAQGVLLNLLSDSFYYRQKSSVGNGKRNRLLLNAAQLMSPEQRKNESGIPQCKVQDRCLFFYDVLKVVKLLHSKDLIVGDFSAVNLAVEITTPSIANEGRRFMPKFLDVDTFFFHGSISPIAQANTPHWYAPELNSARKHASALNRNGAGRHEVLRAQGKKTTTHTKQSDVYKVGLLILRLLHIPDDIYDDDTQIIMKSGSALETIERLFGTASKQVVHSMLSNDPLDRPALSEVLKVLPPIDQAARKYR